MWGVQIVVEHEKQRIRVDLLRLLDGIVEETPIPEQVLRLLRSWGLELRDNGKEWEAARLVATVEQAHQMAKELINFNLRLSEATHKPLVHTVSLVDPQGHSWVWLSDDYLLHCAIRPNKGIVDESLFWLTVALGNRMSDLHDAIDQAVQAVAEEGEGAAQVKLSAALRDANEVVALLEAYRSRLYSRGNH